MNVMNSPIDAWPMHPPVRPVKISVMDEQIDGNGDQRPPNRISANLTINFPDVEDIPCPQRCAGNDAINRAPRERIRPFHPHLRP